MSISSQISDALRCPECKGELGQADAMLRCPSCELDYRLTESGSMDLRLKSPKEVTLSLTINRNGGVLDSFDGLGPFPLCSDPDVDFGPSDVRRHVSRIMLSHFTRAKSDSELALDLGCGSAVHKELLEKCGYTYVGVDYNRETAPILGDAHALPFADNSFSFIISIAVLEHLCHPIVAMREVNRVLKPGGSFLGTVAFLEPFHGNSFYHHTHRGTANNLIEAGFEIKHIGYNEGWIAPISLRKKLFPKLQPWLNKSLVWPLHATSTLFWKLGSLKNGNPALIHRYRRNLAGSFAFLARKPEESTQLEFQ